MNLADQVLEELRAASSRERSENEKRYLKSARIHIGCGMPHVDVVVRGLRKRSLTHDEILGLIEGLWDSGIFEGCMVAAKLAAVESKKLGVPELFVFEQMLRESGGWALVDTLSTGVIGSIVAGSPDAAASVLDRWATDRDFWVRRAAMLALLKPLRRGEGDWKRFTRYADSMLEEKEFFIRKAIGWVLRETSKKRPDLVYRWMEPRAARASGVTFREAVKYLSDEQREDLKRRRAAA